MRVLIKGAGDLATGVACSLYQAGFQILMTELSSPTVIRREVAFAQAVYQGWMEVEEVRAHLVGDLDDAWAVIEDGDIPILIDEDMDVLQLFQPDVLVEATLAKHNTGIDKDMAPLVVALGPGFIAGVDADVVVETMRGHNLGRLIYSGGALPNTNTPGVVGGKSTERLLRATGDGLFETCAEIGQFVHAGDLLAYCGGVEMTATIDGYLRGLLHPELPVFQGMKVGDIDPRCEQSHCFTISDKARALGGSVLTAIMRWQFNQNCQCAGQSCQCR
ncbi:MAG: EF2563 family selenium-dependent molybdenum hydroxylase system protein [Firmicutes bacterium]|nr:EF2563 family selenium-dependent molybdenum hydroxylase system protein [Bacillota bacterium]